MATARNIKINQFYLNSTTQSINYSSIRTFLIKTVAPSNEQHCTVYVFEVTILLFESHLNFGVPVIVRLKHRLVFLSNRVS